MLISGFHSDRAEIEAVLRALRGRVDGLIVLSPDVDAQALRRNLPETLPVVLLNTPSTASRRPAALSSTPSISTTTAGRSPWCGTWRGLGHRRIALIRGPEENADARERLRGYRDALRARGDRARPTALELGGDFSEESGYRGGAAPARR